MRIRSEEDTYEVSSDLKKANCLKECVTNIPQEKIMVKKKKKKKKKNGINTQEDFIFAMYMDIGNVR